MSEQHNESVEPDESTRSVDVGDYDPDEDQDTEGTNMAPEGERPIDQKSSD